MLVKRARGGGVLGDAVGDAVDGELVVDVEAHRTPHRRTVPSHDPEASARPSGEKATLRTQNVCPSSVRSSAPLAASHSRMVRSLDAEASSRPSGEKAISATPPLGLGTLPALVA